MIKNFKKEEVLIFKDQVNCQEGQVVSKTLSQNEHHSLTLFSFDKNEEISTHESQGDALVLILEGQAKITIEGKDFFLKEGESILMPKNKPHAVFAKEKFKMLLMVMFD